MARKKPLIPKKQFNKAITDDAIKVFDGFYTDFRKVIYNTEGDAADDVVKAGVAALRPLLEKKKKELQNGK